MSRRSALQALLAAAGLLLAGCAGAPSSSGAVACPVSLDLAAADATPDEEAVRYRSLPGSDGQVMVELFYGTNRLRTSDCHPDRIYGAQSDALELGQLRVTIPRDHRLGELETPSIWRLELSPDPEKHVVLSSVRPLEPDTFDRALAEAVSSSASDEAFVFVHGFNIPFEEAARRSAQIAYDLKFPGVPMLFSWPSDGRIMSYLRDREVGEASGPALAEFLDRVTQRSGASTIHLIAHSMGAHVLGAGLRTLREETQARRFEEIVLAAPDVDARDFEAELATLLADAGTRVTLYASARDRALEMARSILGIPRAGDTQDGIVIHERIETVDATAVDTSFTGHSYYGENRSVMSDLFTLLRDRQSARARFGLVPVETVQGTYWRFQR